MMRHSLVRKLGRHRHGEKGATAVEFALTAPVLIAMMLGIMECGKVYWADHALSQAVYDAGRYAMVNTTASNSQISTYLNSRLLGINPQNITTTFTTDVAGGKNFLRITTVYTYAPVLANMGFQSIQISNSSRVPRG